MGCTPHHLIFPTGDTSGVTVPSSSLEQQNIAVYCAGDVGNALVVLALEGLVLRLCTLLALYLCPKGMTLEPLVLAVGSGISKLKNWISSRRKAARRRTATGGATAGAV